MEFEELMRDFAARIGLADLTIEDDAAAIEIDGNPFGFIYNPGSGTLILVADLGVQPGSADRPLGSMMLKANFLYEALDGAVLFQNPDNEAFGIQQRFRLVDLDVDSLSAQVERFANLADEWRDIVAGYGEAEAAAQAQAASEEPPAPFSCGGFMRV